MKKELVVKDNALINASYNLDLSEQRLILLAILEARQSNTPNDKDLTIHAESYINHFNVHRNKPPKIFYRYFTKNPEKLPYISVFNYATVGCIPVIMGLSAI